jgi:hypothetical protein
MNLSNITTITSSTTLSTSSNTYLVNAGTTGGIGVTGPPIIITLPPINIDGMNYKLTREDISQIPVTIQGTGGNLIIQNLGITGTVGSALTGPVSLLASTSAEFQSFRNNWYITNSPLDRTIGRAIFSTAFVANNGQLFFLANGSVGQGTTTVVCIFTYPGTNFGATAVALETIVQNGAGGNPPAATIFLREHVSQGTGTVYGTGLYTPTSNIGPLSIATISSFSNLPATPTIVEFGVTVIGPNSSRVRVYSMSLR